MTEGSSGFEVRSSKLPPAFDLLAACSGEPGQHPFLFEREGIGVASPSMSGGTGVAESATPEAIAGMGREMIVRLRDLAADALGPVAMGQIPFSERGHAWMRVPMHVVRRSGSGEPWLIELVPNDGDARPFAPVRPVGGAPAEPFPPSQVAAVPPADGYRAMVSTAVERIREGALRKVVLARTMQVDAGRTLDPLRLAHRLRAVDPHAFTFITPDGPEASSLVGASPELLVSKRGLVVRSTPLAGSAPRSGDPEEDRANADALLASAKNREEHAIVVEAIEDVLGTYCERLDHDREPVLVETANVWHLATRFEGQLRDPSPSVVELVAALHPTPAVGGTPTAIAKAAIDELEPFDRGGYAGAVGWMDAHGDGEWAIALRCARLDGQRATLFAGAGIVADSQPADELDETDRKFRAFLDSLRWG